MNDRDLGLYVSMLHFCDRIKEKVDRFRVDEDLWFADEDIRDMIYVSVQQIGEKAAKLSDPQQDFPDLEWPGIKGMRNVLVHNYNNIDPQIVWNTITTEVPPLRRALLSNQAIRNFYEQSEPDFANNTVTDLLADLSTRGSANVHGEEIPRTHNDEAPLI